MRVRRVLIGMTLTGFALAVGCGGSGDNGNGGGSGGSAGAAADGGSTGGSSAGGSSSGGSSSGGSSAGGTSSGGSSAGGTGATGAGGSSAGGAGGSGATAGSGGSAGCQVATCQGKTYACGDCKDNDNDGKVDMDDPDCLGPCDNNESGYHGCIAGQNNAPCKADCYFDQDTGSGNDDCYWNHKCDKLEVKPDYPPEGKQCSYDPNTTVSGTTQSCTQLYNKQSTACGNYCGPLTPNGCDCFGCCELPAGSGKYVYLGSTSDDSGKCSTATCDLAHVNDPSKCKPCTPVKGCLNDCKHCELCLGKTKLPKDCLPPPPPDGGAGSGGTTGTGGSGTGGSGTGGSGTGGSGGGCGGQICPTGAQPCGLSCQPPCPTGQYCNTGCCVNFPG